ASSTTSPLAPGLTNAVGSKSAVSPNARRAWAKASAGRLSAWMTAAAASRSASRTGVAAERAARRARARDMGAPYVEADDGREEKPSEDHGATADPWAVRRNDQRRSGGVSRVVAATMNTAA